MCVQNLSINKIIDFKNIDLLNSYLDGCEATCPNWNSCQEYSLMEQNIRLLDGQATLCKLCQEIVNFEDLENGYCDKCMRAIGSRC